MMTEEETIVERLEKEINIIHPKALEIQLKLYDVFIPILCSIIIPVNLLICLSSGLILHRKYSNYRKTARSTYIFLGNVALSDLLIGIVTLAIQYFPKDLFNEMFCCIGIALHVCSTLVSIWTVGLIAIDRFLYILYGLYYQTLVSSQRARCMVLAIWILSGLISFLPAIGLRNPTDNGKLCWFIVLFPPKLVLFTVCFAAIPLALITVLYSIILKQALLTISSLHRASVGNQRAHVGDIRRFRGGSSSSRTSVDNQINEICLQEVTEVPIKRRINKISNINNQVTSASKWKAIKIVLLTTGAFLITWLPYYIAATLYALCDPYSNFEYCRSLLVAIARPLTVLGMCNSLLNPIIYAWWHNGFREAVKKIYKGFFSGRFQTEETNILTRSSHSRRVTIKVKSELEEKQRLQEGLNVVVAVTGNSPMETGNENSIPKTTIVEL